MRFELLNGRGIDLSLSVGNSRENVKAEAIEEFS
jgi:hypothetical protein